MRKQSEFYDVMAKKFGHKIIEFRDKWKKAEDSEDITNFPLHLNFELNSGCNLKCEMCLHSLPFKDWPYKIEPDKIISFDKFRKIIDEGIEYGLCSIEFNGINEPLIKNNISKYIKYAHKEGILITSLHTNGLLLTEFMSEKLIESGLTFIIFSLDAFTKETYLRIRKKSNYNRTIKNILNFLEIKKKKNKEFPLTKVSFSMNRVNIHELSEFLDFWDDKVDFYSTSYFCNPFIGKDNYEKIEKRYRINKGNVSFECKESNVRLLIRNNGDVCPCCSFFAGEIIVGNIYKDSIYDIWNSEYMQETRSKIKSIKNNVCKKCIRSMGIFNGKK